MKKLFASAGKLAGIAGIKTTEMRDFLNNISSNLDVRKESFTNGGGEFIEYDNYEVVKALAYYESYQQEMEKLANKAVKAAIHNTVLPEIEPIKKKEKPQQRPNRKIPEINVNEDEIPF